MPSAGVTDFFFVCNLEYGVQEFAVEVTPDRTMMHRDDVPVM